MGQDASRLGDSVSVSLEVTSMRVGRGDGKFLLGLASKRKCKFAQSLADPEHDSHIALISRPDDAGDAWPTQKWPFSTCRRS